MAVVKRSVSVDQGVWSEVERLALDVPGGVSGVVTASLRELLARRDGMLAMQEWQRVNGELTVEELAAADGLLDAVGVPDLRPLA